MQPLQLLEQRKRDLFIPQMIVMVEITTETYDACKILKTDGSVKQMMKDLPNVNQDCAWLEDAFSRYGTINFGPNDMFKMLDGPSRTTVKATWDELRKLLEENKHEQIFVAYVFAGHGIVEEGTQTVVLNEFNE